MAPHNRKMICMAAIAIALNAKNAKKKKRKKLWTKQFLLEREQLSYNALNSGVVLEPTDLYGYLKLDQTTYFELLALVSPLIERLDTSMRKAITPHERLYATLLFLATGRSYMDLQFMTRISTQALGTLIPETCIAICKVLSKDYMKFPESQSDWTLIAKDFEEKWKFPNCLGIVGGKHARIMPPPGHGMSYFDQRGFYSLVVTGVLNANYEFLLFDVYRDGRTSDEEVFENTTFGKSLIKNDLPLPDDRTPENGSKPLPYVFVGDEAFPSRSNYLKTFLNEDLQYEQLIYNYRLSRVQTIAENAFGIICDRFRIFHTSIGISVKRCEQVIRTCASLHNFLRKKCPDSYTPDECFYSEDTSKCEIFPGMLPGKNTMYDLRRSPSQIRGQKAMETDSAFMNYFCNEGPLDWQCNIIVKNNLLGDHFLFDDKA